MTEPKEVQPKQGETIAFDEHRTVDGHDWRALAFTVADPKAYARIVLTRDGELIGENAQYEAYKIYNVAAHLYDVAAAHEAELAEEVDQEPACSFTFEEFAAWVKDNRILPEHLQEHTRQVLYWSNKLNEEAGELAGVCSRMAVKRHVDQPDYEKFHDELGDVLHCAAALAATLGVDLGRVLSDNQEKIVARFAGDEG